MYQEAVRKLCNPSESCHVRKVARLSARPLSLRFNQEEFCDELYIHRKSPRLLSSRIQAAVLIAGKRLARPERRPLGLPGDLPQGFGAFAGVPISTKSDETTRWTRTGVSLPLS